MKKNVGKTDRILRIILGIVIISIGIIYQTWWGLVGAGIMLPGLMSSDPLYTLLGVDTNKS
ncbi:MAG: hypothetical protein ACJAVY_002601 [Marinoscillum sp.]|jgi:hypothetical protein